MKKNIVRNVLLVGLELVFVFSVFQACMHFMEMARDTSTTETLIDKVTTVVDAPVETTDDGELEEDNGRFVVDFDSLLAINANIRGWIRYPQAGVNYPLVQGADNDYYLSHDYYKVSNLVGSIFVDHRNRSLADRNVVIFGHNTWNGTMFGQLNTVLSDGFFDDGDNRIIELIDTKNRIRRYEIFSVYVVPDEEYYITTDFQSDAEYREFLETVKERSDREFQSDLAGVTNIITLSTCNDLRITDNKLVIHAKLVK